MNEKVCALYIHFDNWDIDEDINEDINEDIDEGELDVTRSQARSGLT